MVAEFKVYPDADFWTLITSANAARSIFAGHPARRVAAIPKATKNAAHDQPIAEAALKN